MSKVDEREEKKSKHILKSVYVVNDAETHLNSNIKYMQLCWHFLFVYLFGLLSRIHIAIRIFNFNVKQFSIFSYLAFSESFT